MASFGNLYEYSENGILIPQTSSVKAMVESAFSEIFGSDISLDTETPLGRFIEAITILFVSVLSVNAQNSNSMDVSQALGNYLDSLGAGFGINRLEGESDAKYRMRIIDSASRGSGYAKSIRQAVSRISGVTNVCVLDNGYSEPAVLPDSETGIAVKGHSIFVCVAGGADADVASAIYSAKSAGCGYEDSDEYGTVASGKRKEIDITDSSTASTNKVVFYRPTEKSISIRVGVMNAAYRGIDIAGDTERIVRDYVIANSMNATINMAGIVSAIALANIGIVCTNAKLYIGREQHDSVTASPNEYISISSIEVNA